MATNTHSRRNLENALLWGGANIICFFLAWYLAATTTSLDQALPPMLVVAFCYSGLQWIALNRIQPYILCGPVTAFGAVIGFYIAKNVVTQITFSVISALHPATLWTWALGEAIGVGVFGGIVGFAVSISQAFLLRKQQGWPFRWVAINVGGLSVGLFLTTILFYSYKMTVPRSLLDSIPIRGLC